MRAVLWDNWKHLRVPFQPTLMPIFLWGYFLARPWPDGRFWLALAALHFCLYTGGRRIGGRGRSATPHVDGRGLSGRWNGCADDLPGSVEVKCFAWCGG